MADEGYQWRLDDLTASEVLWCAAYMDRIRVPPSQTIASSEDEDKGEDVANDAAVEALEEAVTPPEQVATEESHQPVYIGQQPAPPAPNPAGAEQPESSSGDRASPLQVPVPFPLPQPSQMSKALLPFARRVPGAWATELDIEQTVERTAEANGLPIPVFQRPLQRWFDVCLLIDHSPSMEFWGDLGEGIATLFRWQGIFRDVRLWQFETNVAGRPRLVSGVDAMEREMESLLTPGRDRLFVVVTDTLGKAWRTGSAFDALAVLGAKHPIAIAHVFPKYLWTRTALDRAIMRPLVAAAPGCANDQLVIAARLKSKDPFYRFPIFNLSEQHLLTWAKHIAAAGGTSIQGVLIRQQTLQEAVSSVDKGAVPQPVKDEPSPEALVNDFLSDATPEAGQLASVLAAVPLIPSIMRLAQEQFMPTTHHWHLAEVFFSGLVQRSALSPAEAGVVNRWYEFREGVREVLLRRSSVRTTTEVWREIGNFIEQNIDSLRDALGLIPNPSGSIEDVQLTRELYFAEVRGEVLKTWGGEFASQGQALIDQAQAYKVELQEPPETDKPSEPVIAFPELEDIPFNDAQLVDEPGDPEPRFPPPLQTEDITIITFNQPQQGEQSQQTVITEPIEPPLDIPEGLERFEFKVAKIARDGTRWVVRQRRGAAYRYIETLPEAANPSFLGNIARRIGFRNDLELEMVSIPGGRFLMGSPENEPKRNADRESPQHEVTVPPFLMGRYPVTQAQWRIVANTLPQVNRSLKPNPSRFSGDRLPVEQVNWYNAVEFCDRLSNHTGRQYRLPSEAEWEYACRAGTTTPFNFGDTISTEVANYHGSSYADGPQGEGRGKTTPVDHFGIANAFGLSDMHGNVLEWCQDHWHENYEDAPVDGKAWKEGGDSSFRVRRGGSWFVNPMDCRSAYRDGNYPADGLSFLGFRVCCSSPRALQ